MKNEELRGRPRLNIKLVDVLTAVNRHGRVTTAAQELNCSAAYIHGRMKEAGLTLYQVLEATDLDSLLESRIPNNQ